MRFIKWASLSLAGHLVLFQVTFSVPFSLMFIFLNNERGTLTFNFAIYIVAASSAAGVIAAALIWGIFTSPMIKRRSGGKRK